MTRRLWTWIAAALAIQNKPVGVSKSQRSTVLRKLLMAISLLSIVPLACEQTSTTPPKPTLIKAGRILDVRTGKYLTGQGILVEDGKIEEVAAFARLFPG
jgi:hypothetical protein